MNIYYILILITLGLSYYVSWKLKSKFQTYSKMQLSNGMTGKQIAEKMLADNGITDVRVISTEGELTDHYNPVNKTVNLSQVVYYERNAAAAAVAAHECGHAVQHKIGYSWLKFRSRMVPMVNISSNLSTWLILGGMFLYMYMNIPYVLMFGIFALAIVTLFTFITLPVEYDASNRALIWMEKSGILASQERSAAKDALKWAARTYLVAALSALSQLVYYLSIFLGSRRRD